MEEFLDRVKVWVDRDNSVKITYFLRKTMRLGETEDQFFERVTAKLKERPEFRSHPEHIVSINDLPSDNKRPWRFRNGKVVIEP